MKKIILGIMAGILIIVFLVIGLVPNVNNFLKLHITYEQYTFLIIGLVSS